MKIKNPQNFYVIVSEIGEILAEIETSSDPSVIAGMASAIPEASEVLDYFGRRRLSKGLDW